MSTKKSVDLQGLQLRPVPPELLQSVLCTNCRERAARWEFAEGPNPAWTFACSFCLLYELPTLRDQRMQLDLLIEEVEKKVSTFFPRDDQFRLTKPEDADRIAFGVVMTQRFMQSRTLRGGFSS